MPKNATADLINRDLSTGAVDVNESRLYDTTAKPCAAHNTGDNEYREYTVDAPKKGKLGVVGQAGN
jgi:hypothetical protein